ncbi:senecionine N-oxygenase-like [Teleopsis dalmanni]|uniref:senecionine N-oxygenase-like n=1 Tax=Teleopsis dalmanni TaxID=139649 RepID=UPI0018CD2F58|nr:senecionine N-oxygenase-like [Teleopsis dalmanni]
MNVTNRVCIIGAGTAGLCALKNSIEHGMQATAYEQCDQIGGTWVYYEPTENEEHEDDVQSSMYKDLRTNLPKEVMGFADYDFPESVKESYITCGEVLTFLQSYAKHFNLGSHIKLRHEIIRVRPRRDIWEVLIKDMATDQYFIEYFDFVFVCNGHYTKPSYPTIKDLDIYEGQRLHSHLYRTPDMFKDQNVLIIGVGPSGMDIAAHIHDSAKEVYLSHHMETNPNTDFMTNVIHKPDLERFTKTGAVFKDGSIETFTFVIFCTGYKYTFPFLSTDCGIHVDDNFVQPLYKHCININYNTMSFIGIPFNVLPSQVFDLQVRFALKFYTKQIQLPDRAEMLADLEHDLETRRSQKLPKKRAHFLGPRQFEYYNELATIADITNIKPVIQSIMRDDGCKYISRLNSFRNACYKCINDNEYIKYES